MKNEFRRYVLVPLWLLGVCLCSFGQENDDEEGKEMTSLRELRRQIKFFADVRDYNGIRSIRKQLKDDFDSTKFLALTSEERVLVDYMIGDYTDILEVVRDWAPRHNSSNLYYTKFPPQDGLFNHLLDVAVLDSSQLISVMSDVELQGYEQAFLKLYFQSLLSQSSNSDVSEKDLMKNAQVYLDQYAPTPLDTFVKYKIRRKLTKTDWGATIGVGVARGTFQGEFGNLLRFNLGVLIDLEVNYKNMLAGLRLNGGEGTIRRDFEYEGFWDRGLKVSPFYGGLYLGYTLNVAPFRLVPYYDIGGTMITVAESDLTDDNESFSIGGFTHGPGFSLDFIPPLSWSGFNGEMYRIGLRFKGGMLFNTLKNKNPAFESTYPYVGIELIMDFVGTELDLK